LNSLVDGLLFSLQAEGKTPRTREYYSKLLRHFLDYAKGRGWNDVRSLDVQRAREFLAWTASKTYKHTAGNGTRMIRRGKPTVAWPYFKALRRLFNWAVEEGFIELSPLARTHFKPPSAPPVEPFTLDELKRLLAVCELEMSRRYARGLKAEEAIEAHRNGASPVEGLGLG
jgi:site-specific recombinase XerD